MIKHNISKRQSVSYKSTSSTKYINPTRVPSKKKIKIHKDDPRNRVLHKKRSDHIFEVIDEFGENLKYEDQDISEDYFGEGYDPVTFLDDYSDPIVPIQEDLQIEISLPHLSAPENLTIQAGSYQLEDYASSSDGVVRWVASLVFDDVEGADSYEYIINARE